jgi:BirA family transcriptional regulator, biotin operon repressor / biotin---[acetyl-CoA-carboxylase] ligase
MPISLFHLIEVLADGKFHNGERLGSLWNVSRAAISKAVPKLKKFGIDVYAVRGKGYRLHEKIVLLNRETILAKVETKLHGFIDELYIFPVIESTNTFLLQQIDPLPPNTYRVCLSEMQIAGRGRRGRQWLSPFGYNIYLSMLRELQSGATVIEGLSLVMGIALVRALRSFDVDGLGLKWPNDVYIENRKLAGILVEMTGDLLGLSHVVVGVGVNVKLTHLQRKQIDQPIISLEELGFSISQRNILVAALIQNLMQAIDELINHGFVKFKSEWEALDVTKDKAVTVNMGNDCVSGIAQGVDLQGALLIAIGSELRRITSGDVSLRMQNWNAKDLAEGFVKQKGL